jgi:alcohol dehydrogenase class IV
MLETTSGAGEAYPFSEEYEFFIPVRLLGGEEAIWRNRELLGPLGKRCLLVTGKHSAVSSGARQDVEKALADMGIFWAVFDGIGENPRLEDCRRAARICRQEEADFVIGIGGGSPMDAAKAVAVLALDPELPEEALFGKKWPGRPLPSVVVGTTSGTGSEISAVSVLTCPDGRKRSISAPSLYPALSFGDPRYTYSMSRAATITTGLDAFAHAAEGYFSPKCGKITASFGEMAIPVLWKNLYKLYKGEELTEAMHKELYEASLWAGFVLAANGTSFPHPYGYVLTERYGVPHGRACTTFFPALLKRVEETAPERARRLLELCGCSREELMEVIRSMSDTESIRMSGEEIEELRSRFHGLKHYGNVPGGYDEERGLAVFRELFSDETNREGEKVL